MLPTRLMTILVGLAIPMALNAQTGLPEEHVAEVMASDPVAASEAPEPSFSLSDDDRQLLLGALNEQPAALTTLLMEASQYPQLLAEDRSHPSSKRHNAVLSHLRSNENVRQLLRDYPLTMSALGRLSGKERDAVWTAMEKAPAPTARATDATEVAFTESWLVKLKSLADDSPWKAPKERHQLVERSASEGLAQLQVVFRQIEQSLREQLLR